MGKRFYEFGHPQRTLFVFAPEKMASYPHFHGLVREPDDSNSLRPVSDFPAHLKASWQAVVPAGNCHIVDLKDEGAMLYASKETGLDHDFTACSVDFWSPKSLRS